jgi:GNAT superfamily N-acetyltransferase
MTPFQKPPDLEAALALRGYGTFGHTLVQVLALAHPPEMDGVADADLDAPPIGEFVDAVGELRGSPSVQRAAHLERLGSTPLTTHAVIARIDGAPAACGQMTLDNGLAGVFDMVTAPNARGRGLARLIVHELLTWAWGHGATHAYLQVNDDNAPALAVYRRFGFATVYTYHYRARPGECR